MFNVTL